MLSPWARHDPNRTAPIVKQHTRPRPQVQVGPPVANTNYPPPANSNQPVVSDIASVGRELGSAVSGLFKRK